jgi:hypothetical protein
MKKATNNSAANLIANKKANAKAIKETTKAAAKGAKSKDLNFEWSTMLAMNKAYKAQSLFSVLRFLNEQSEITSVFGTLTIDGLKNLTPDYFMTNVRDKKTKKVTSIPRVEFKPFTFMKALRKATPADLKPKAKKAPKRAPKVAEVAK